MPNRKNKQSKAGTKSAERATAQEQSIVNAKYGLLSVVSLLIGACLIWWVLRKYRRKALRKEISQDGYVLVNGRSEHRLIAERFLGRKLVAGEVVHHINGIKTDNRESNLCVLEADAHDHFHDWLARKVEKDGGYPTKSYQRAVLRDRYNGILLVTYPSDLPPLDSDSESEPRRGGKVS